MQDVFADHSVGLTAPASRATNVTPDDNNDLSQFTRGLYVGQPGSLRVRTVSGDEATFENMLGGVFYPIRVERVFATGTTATNIIGLS